MPDDIVPIVVLGLLALVPLWLVWRFLKFASRGLAAFKNPAVSRRVKATGIGLPAIGFLLAGAGALPGIAWREGGMHLGVLGVTLFLGGVWLMSTADRPFKHYEKISTVAIFALGIVLAIVGVVHALVWPQKPVFGTASVGDLFSAGGFMVAFSGLWGIAPGGTGGPAGGLGGGGDGGGGGC